MAGLPPGMQLPPQMIAAIMQMLQSNPITNTPAPPQGSGIQPAQMPNLSSMMPQQGQQSPLPPSAGQMSPTQIPQMLQQLFAVLNQMRK
jgi:hypothetical protein